MEEKNLVSIIVQYKITWDDLCVIILLTHFNPNRNIFQKIISHDL